jgi:small-conductance mechanosensitive channel
MSVADNAAVAIDKGVGTIESLANWFVANRDALPVGLAVAAGIVAVMLAIRWLGGWLQRGDPYCTHWRGVIGRVLAKTTLFFMVAAAFDIVVTFAEVPARIGRLLDILFIIAFSFQGAIWARELILGTIARKVGEDRETTLGNAAAVIRVLVSVAVFALAIIVVLDNLGANVTALIAGLGVGGIAIGLAAQGIFSDLFAALSILFDRPFRRGDTIRYDNSIGTVERIGLKTTRIRSLTGEQLIMANTKLLEREIHNLAEGESRRSSLPFGLVYHSSPEQLEKVPSLAKGAVEARKGCHFVRCAILGFGASSIDFELLYDSPGVDWNAIGADRTAVAIALLRAFAKHKLEFAYPTQTTYTAAPDGSLVMPWPSVTPVVRVEPETVATDQKRSRKPASK